MVCAWAKRFWLKVITKVVSFPSIKGTKWGKISSELPFVKRNETQFLKIVIFLIVLDGFPPKASTQ